MEGEENHVRLYRWGLQSLVSGVWGTVIYCRLRHDPALWRIQMLLFFTVLVTFCEFCVKKLSTRYKNLSGICQSLKYGVMFGLSPPDRQSVYENIEKVESPINVMKSVFIVFDLFILTLTWKLEKLRKFVFEEKNAFDLLCICAHYSLLLWIGILDWIFINFLGAIYIIPYLLVISVNDAQVGRANGRMREG